MNKIIEKKDYKHSRQAPNYNYTIAILTVRRSVSIGCLIVLFCFKMYFENISRSLVRIQTQFFSCTYYITPQTSLKRLPFYFVMFPSYEFYKADKCKK
jgi:hypothetical protein